MCHLGLAASSMELYPMIHALNNACVHCGAWQPSTTAAGIVCQWLKGFAATPGAARERMGQVMIA